MNSTFAANCTTKQFGDAGEYLVAAKLTFAGLPTVKLSDNWPGYDLLALPQNGAIKISVKTRRQDTTKSGNIKLRVGEFDWLAVVLLPLEGGEPLIWLLPRDVVLANSIEFAKTSERRIYYKTLFGPLARYRDNLRLDPEPV